MQSALTPDSNLRVWRRPHGGRGGNGQITAPGLGPAAGLRSGNRSTSQPDIYEFISVMQVAIR
jgi:hypothetical protein